MVVSSEDPAAQPGQLVQLVGRMRWMWVVGSREGSLPLALPSEQPGRDGVTRSGLGSLCPCVPSTQAAAAHITPHSSPRRQTGSLPFCR